MSNHLDPSGGEALSLVASGGNFIVFDRAFHWKNRQRVSALSANATGAQLSGQISSVPIFSNPRVDIFCGQFRRTIC